MTSRYKIARRLSQRALYSIATSGIVAVIIIGGILLYVFTNQALASYLVGLVGLAVAAIGLILASKIEGSPSVDGKAESTNTCEKRPSSGRCPRQQGH